MSAGENPTSMPWRAAVKPIAQKIAAPAPHRMPMVEELVLAGELSGTDDAYAPQRGCASAPLSWLPEGFRNGCRNA